MATAIRQVELSEPLTPLCDLQGHQSCMLVFRWKGRVIGRAFVDVEGVRLEVDQVAEAAKRCDPKDALPVWLADHVGYDARATLPTPDLTATVVICTRERPADLARALDAVTALADAPLEILVVDNAPASGRTRAVVERYPRVRYISEPRAGLDIARNRAIDEAAGDIMAFTDDDAIPEREWLGALVANFRDPRVQCATGLTLPIELETEAQELFEQYCSFSRGFRRRVFDGQHDNPLAVGPVGAGANMAIRRRVFAEIGRFDERLDAGTPARSGGDHEMFTRILRAGFRIAYDPAAVSWHRHRRTHDELRDTIYGYGVGVYAMWTGLLVERRELGVLRLAWSWFRGAHVPELLRILSRRRTRSSLARTELRGCLRGPLAWRASKRAADQVRA